MGYSIQYEPELNHKYQIKQQFIFKYKIIVPVLIAIVIIIGAMTPLKKHIIEFIVPGRAKITAAAFSDLVTNVQAGEPVYDALTCFCKELIYNA